MQAITSSWLKTASIKDQSEWTFSPFISLAFEPLLKMLSLFTKKLLIFYLPSTLKLPNTNLYIYPSFGLIFLNWDFPLLTRSNSLKHVTITMEYLISNIREQIVNILLFYFVCFLPAFIDIISVTDCKRKNIFNTYGKKIKCTDKISCKQKIQSMHIVKLIKFWRYFVIRSSREYKLGEQW